MCGIFSIFAVVSEEYKERMKQARERAQRLIHRGPDAQGEYLFEFGGQFHLRLSLVDEKSGAQPIKSPDGSIILSVNGEIYNNLELKKELKEDHKFHSMSDCEIIWALMKERPETFIDDLRGMFAFVLMDTKTKQVVIARDHGGMCPLYWGSTNSASATGEEIKGKKRKMDDDGEYKESGESKEKMAKFTRWDKLAETSIVPLTPSTKWVSSDMRGMQDVCDVFEHFPPGHAFVGDYSTGAGKLVEWYQPRWKTDGEYIPPLRTKEECIQQIYDRGTKVVLSHWKMRDKHVKAIVPLSGGLDSSTVVGILANDAKENGEEPIHTCSTGIKKKDGTILSEDVLAARDVAKKWSTIHHEFLYTIEEALAVRKKVIQALESCWITTVRASLCMYLMARDLKKMGYKMVELGSVVDEIFAGYAYFKWCPNPAEMQKELVRKVTGLYLMDTLREAKIFGAHGIECRIPFFDREFLDYVMEEIHPLYKMWGVYGEGKKEKWMFQEAFEKLLPDSVKMRSKTQFSDGVGSILIDTLKEDAKLLVSDKELTAAATVFPHNPPDTHEGCLYRKYFETFFPHPCAIQTVPGGKTISCSSPAALAWHEDFKKNADDSGRSVKV